jgi:hypothetical protein
MQLYGRLQVTYVAIVAETVVTVVCDGIKRYGSTCIVTVAETVHYLRLQEVK